MEILDELESEKTNKYFSTMTLFTSTVMFSLIVYEFINVGRKANATDLIEFNVTIIRTIQILAVFSFVTMLISYIRKEPKSKRKMIGTFLTILLLLFIGGTIAYSVSLDAGK